MKKFLKWFFILAAAGTAIGLIVAYFCKDEAEEWGEDDSDLTEDEDFDLDVDLKPASEREYVSLHGKNTDETAVADEPAADEPAADTSAADTSADEDKPAADNPVSDKPGR